MKLMAIINRLIFLRKRGREATPSSSTCFFKLSDPAPSLRYLVFHINLPHFIVRSSAHSHSPPSYILKVESHYFFKKNRGGSLAGRRGMWTFAPPRSPPFLLLFLDTGNFLDKYLRNNFLYINTSRILIQFVPLPHSPLETPFTCLTFLSFEFLIVC